MTAPGAVVTSAGRPVPSMAGVLDLMDDLAGLAGAAEGLRRRLEQLTGLRGGELQTLLAVSGGADRTEVVAERTGQVDEAAAATLRALQHRGLVTGPGTGLPEAWRLTDSGQVVHQQAEGLGIRVLHGVVGALGEEATGEFRSTVQALVPALSLDGPGEGDPLSGMPRALG